MSLFPGDEPCLVVVMYHFIYNDPPKILKHIPHLKSSVFVDQIRQMKSAGFVFDGSMSLSDFILNSRVKGPRFLLSFDDTLRCHSKVVAPILDDENVKGAFSVYTKPWEDEKFTSLEMQRLIQYSIFHYDKFLEVFFEACRDKLSISETVLEKIKPNNENIAACINLYPSDKFYSNEERFFRFIRDDVLKFKDFELVISSLFERYFSQDDLHKELYMTRGDVQALVKGGHSILAHSHMHPFSPAGFEGNNFYEDIIKNGRILMKTLGFQPDGFTYPCGIKTNDYASALQRTGYKFALTAGEYNFSVIDAPQAMSIKRVDAAQFDPTSQSILPFLNHI